MSCILPCSQRTHDRRRPIVCKGQRNNGVIDTKYIRSSEIILPRAVQNYSGFSASDNQQSQFRLKTVPFEFLHVIELSSDEEDTIRAGKCVRIAAYVLACINVFNPDSSVPPPLVT